MDLECVSVCVGYGDFLAETAPVNRHLFDRWLIITRPQDEATREVCRRYNLDVLLSEEGSRNGAFRKGHLIERGLQHLSAGAWRLHLDADVALPANLRHLLRAADLQEDCLYGCDRVLLRSWADWRRLVSSGWLSRHHDYHCRLGWPEGVPWTLGTRWAHPREGYCPIGFFQLWHAAADEWRGVRIKPYPRDHGNACRTDVQHALQWDRRRRLLLPEVVAVHLESEVSVRGVNWNGRTSKPFEAGCPLGPS